MIKEILEYFQRRKLLIGTPEQCLLFAWTEYCEWVETIPILPDGEDKLTQVEEAGDIVMMLYLLAHTLGLDVTEDVEPRFTGLSIREALQELTEFFLSSMAFVRNNPDKEDRYSDAGMEELISQVILSINISETGYIKSLDQKLSPRGALRRKMVRKLGHGFGPREGAGYGSD